LEDRDWAFARSRSELLMYADLWRRISVAYGLEIVVLVGGLEPLRYFEKNTFSAFLSKISSNSMLAAGDVVFILLCRMKRLVATAGLI
jgi:hypothetical protein